MVKGARPPALPKAGDKKAKARADLRIGPFVLIDELGSGAHARIFRARYDPEKPERNPRANLGDVVVLKILRDPALKMARVVDGFTREAELLCMIDHPGVIRGVTRG